jgi:hypothetical protein
MFTYITDLSKPLRKTIDGGSGGTMTRYPTNMGLTGLAFTERSVISSNQLDTDMRFNSDIDNVLLAKSVRNIVTFEIGSF